MASTHFIIFPFMARGHTIPLLYLGRLLRQHSVAATIFTTAGNSPWIRESLQDTDIKILELPFPQKIDGIPPGVESTDKLPSMAYFVPFAVSTKLMQLEFEKAIENLQQPATCIISDLFLGWTQQSAAKLGIPRLVFSGMGNFGSTMYQILGRDRPHAGTASLDSPFLIPAFPWLKLTRNDFEPPFCDIEPAGPWVDFMMEPLMAMSRSHGFIVNSFYELESSYIDFWNQELSPKVWCVGPLCVAKPVNTATLEKSLYIQFLDEKFAENKPVLYVSFGTQSDVSSEQLHEVAEGLEKSQVSFLWVLRLKHVESNKSFEGFEGRVKNRGILVKEWVDQMQILQHKAVKGFLCHCGWNSLMESVVANVPILALPMMSDQHLNARLMTEEIGAGLRLVSVNGSVRGLVTAGEVEEKVKELMEGEKGQAVRRKVEETREAACGATKEGGSSWHTLNFLIDDVCGKRLSQSYPLSQENQEFLGLQERKDLLNVGSK